jgi:hypothetical protein
VAEPIARIVGSKELNGFDFDHLKIAFAYNKIYISYNALLCLKKKETRISSDVLGCVLPHRFAKSCRRMAIKRNSIIEEYSGQLINKPLKRDLKYIYLNTDDKTDRIDYLLRKVHMLKKNDCVFNIINNTAQNIYKCEIINHDEDVIIIDIIKNIGCLETTFINDVKINDPSNLNKKKQSVSIFNNNTNYYSSNVITNIKIYNNTIGLIPPLMIEFVGEKCKNRHIYCKKSFIILKKLNVSGNIINNIFDKNDYLCILINDLGLFKKGHIVYCNVNSILNGDYVMNYGEDNEWPCKRITVSSITRYSDLEDYADNN